MRSVVLIQGTLSGMGYESECEMLAVREYLPQVGRPIYYRCSVIKAAPHLPDGEYIVMFDGHAVPAIKESGLWIPDGRAPHYSTQCAPLSS